MNAHEYRKKALRESLELCRKKQVIRADRFQNDISTVVEKIKTRFETEIKILFDEVARLCSELQELGEKE